MKCDWRRRDGFGWHPLCSRYHFLDGSNSLTPGAKVVAESIANDARKHKWKSHFRTLLRRSKMTMHIKAITVNIQHIADGRSTSVWTAEQDTDGPLVTFLVDNLPSTDPVVPT